jgi:type IV fimbrial biogenesis protein FimT
MTRRITGFTKVELLTVVTIIGELAMLAGPSFSNLIADQRAKNASTDLFTAISIARSEAIKRNTKIALQQKSGDWANGWEIVDPDDPTLKIVNHGELSGASVEPTPSTVASIVYLSSGRLQGNAAPAFTITTTLGSSTSTRTLCIDPSGRPYVNSTSCG